MKRILTAILALALCLGLAACGSDTAADAPDLQAYYDDFMASLGEEDAPMMMEITDDLVDSMYPGLSDYELSQRVLHTAAISAVAFEMALVEVADAADVEAVKGIFQSRIDSQVEGGAMYPATVEAWQNQSHIVDRENYVALFVGEGSDQMAELFNAAGATESAPEAE